jgi:hypothetical protein
MATKERTMSAPLRTAPRTSQGLVGQMGTVLLQPRAFFRQTLYGRQWLWVASLILVIFGFTASNQMHAGTTSTSTNSSTSQAQSFDLTLLQTGTGDQTTDTTTQPSAIQTTTDTADTNTMLMSALLAACGVLAMWGGQILLLSLVPMLNGHRPKIGRSLRIVVWASLPLALMLGLRQLYFAAGGTGGAVGLSLLLDEWDGYTALAPGAQRLLAAFLSNISLFWLWSLILLYCGARYGLNGKRWVAVLVVLVWITAVPTVTALVSEPVTTVAPRTTTSATTSSSSASDSSSSGTTTITQPMDMGGGFMGGGQPPSGNMGPGGSPPYETVLWHSRSSEFGSSSRTSAWGMKRLPC